MSSPSHASASTGATHRPGCSPACGLSGAEQCSRSGLVDVPAPSAGLHPAALDELLEALGVGLDLTGVGTDRGTGLLRGVLGFPVHLDHHARLLVADAVEGDDAGVAGVAGDAAPGDPLIGVLLGDLGLELARLPAHSYYPAVAGVVDLGDGVHAVHELRKGLELGPLVIGGADRDVHLDGFLDRAHRKPPSDRAHRVFLCNSALGGPPLEPKRHPACPGEPGRVCDGEVLKSDPAGGPMRLTPHRVPRSLLVAAAAAALVLAACGGTTDSDPPEGATVTEEPEAEPQGTATDEPEAELEDAPEGRSEDTKGTGADDDAAAPERQGADPVPHEGLPGSDFGLYFSEQGAAVDVVGVPGGDGLLRRALPDPTAQGVGGLSPPGGGLCWRGGNVRWSTACGRRSNSPAVSGG